MNITVWLTQSKDQNHNLEIKGTGAHVGSTPGERRKKMESVVRNQTREANAKQLEEKTDEVRA